MTDLWLQAVFAFTGGVLLNLAPCVLPVLPFKVHALIAETGQTSRARLIAALALAAGSLAVFLPLGLASAYLNLQWGFLFQSRVFLLMLIVLLFAAGAVMALHVPIRLPSKVYEAGAAGSGPFLTGALAGVLSTPCTGPFLGSVLAFSLTQPASATVTIFAAIGLGLAAPYVLLLAIPGLIDRLPRGGAWLARIEELMGFILLGGAVFFIGSIVSPALQRAAAFSLVALFVLWAVWHLLNRESTASRLLPAVCVALVGSLVAADSLRDSEPLPWQPYSHARRTAALEQQRPLLIEFTADWCINCKVLERTVYSDAEVVALASESGLLTLQVDMTQADAPQQRLLRSFGGGGIPFAIVIEGDGRIVSRFPDLFGASQLIEAIVEATDETGRITPRVAPLTRY
ncbi:MAG: protein-disulfide reductase DsbD family protein [Gammaproteobacteria bacterium]|nr:thioredoxin family protein [Gammaproteobacteria bacterium]MBA3731707.1 thioredoxin family protein [Gammaproteobacteria bacterium]